MSSDLLRTALTSPDPRQALAAARALAGLPDEQLGPVIATLSAELSSPSPAAQRRAALVCGVLGRFASALGTPLRGLLQSPRWPAREAALHALVRVDAEDEVTRSAAASCAVLDRSAAVRQAAVDLLARPSSEVPGVIAAALDHRHPRVRCRALRAVARLAPAAHVATLAAALTHSHRRVRRTSAELLGSLGELALPAAGRLARCRCDGDITVAASARAAFVKLRPHLSAALQPLSGEGTDPIALLDALLANLPPQTREAVAATRRRRRDALAGQGAKSDPRAEARWLVGWLVAELTTRRGCSP